MNSNQNNKKEQLIRELEEALRLKEDSDKINFERDKIQLDLMHLVNIIMNNKKWSKADLAKNINTSKAYISQLFSCDKKLNLETLAKIKYVSNVRFRFEIESKENLLQDLETL